MFHGGCNIMQEGGEDNRGGSEFWDEPGCEVGLGLSDVGRIFGADLGLASGLK